MRDGTSQHGALYSRRTSYASVDGPRDAITVDNLEFDALLILQPKRKTDESTLKPIDPYALTRRYERRSLRV